MTTKEFDELAVKILSKSNGIMALYCEDTKGTATASSGSLIDICTSLIQAIDSICRRYSIPKSKLMELLTVVQGSKEFEDKFVTKETLY